VVEVSLATAACPVQSSQITDHWLLIPEVSDVQTFCAND